MSCNFFAKTFGKRCVEKSSGIFCQIAADFAATTNSATAQRGVDKSPTKIRTGRAHLLLGQAVQRENHQWIMSYFFKCGKA